MKKRTKKEEAITAAKYYDLIPILIQGLKEIKSGTENASSVAAKTLYDWDRARGTE